MLSKILLLVLLVSVEQACFGQLQPVPAAALKDSMGIQPKPVLMLVSTSWCKYCHLQKRQIQKNKDFMKHREQMYFTELDAETKDSISFNDNLYKYKSFGLSTGVHELAIALAGDKDMIAYPMWVLLDQHYNVVFRHMGLLTPGDFKLVFGTLAKMNKSRPR